MRSYIVLILALFVVAGCNGASSNDSALPDQDQSDQTEPDDRFGWGGVTEIEDETVVVEEDDDVEEDVSPTAVRISGGVSTTIRIFQRIERRLTASGGTGNYEWIVEGDLPEGVGLVEEDDDVVKVAGVADTAGIFSGKIKACDLEASDNCAEKEYTITVKDIIFAATTSSYERMETPGCMGMRPVISEIPSAGTPPLVKGAFNPATLDLPFPDKKFKATGGVGPYTWELVTELEDELFYCAFHNCNPPDEPPAGVKRSAWRNSGPDDGDTSIYNLIGDFEEAIVYCGETQNAPLWQCAPGVEQSLRETLKFKVTDSCGVSSEQAVYPFKLTSPPETIDDLYLEVRMWGHDQGDSSTSYIRFRLYKDFDEVVAESRDFAPYEDDGATWKIGFDVKPEYRGMPISNITWLKVWMRDDSCGQFFDITINWFFLTGKYWYVYDDGDLDYAVYENWNCAGEAREETHLVKFLGGAWHPWQSPMNEPVPRGNTKTED